MLFYLEDSCFQNSDSTIHLLALASRTNRGRHQLVVSNVAGVNYCTWRQRQTPDVLDPWDLALDSSIKSQAREPAIHEVIASQRTQSDFSTSPPELSVLDAVSLAEQPFRVALENDNSDRAFILTFADSEQRSRLQELAGLGFFIFEHCGGITEMPRKISELANFSTLSKWNTFAIFDNDALQPNRPSTASDTVVALCTDKSVEHHRLNRRAIENYLSKKSLTFWTYSMGKSSRDTRKPVFKAYCKLTSDQAHHFNMKGGLNGDARVDGDGAGTLFDAVAERDIRSLRSGFGRSVASLFVDDKVSEDCLKKDGSWAEVNQVVSQILTLLR